MKDRTVSHLRRRSLITGVAVAVGMTPLVTHAQLFSLRYRGGEFVIDLNRFAADFIAGVVELNAGLRHADYVGEIDFWGPGAYRDLFQRTTPLYPFVQFFSSNDFSKKGVLDLAVRTLGYFINGPFATAVEQIIQYRLRKNYGWNEQQAKWFAAAITWVELGLFSGLALPKIVDILNKYLDKRSGRELKYTHVERSLKQINFAIDDGTPFSVGDVLYYEGSTFDKFGEYFQYQIIVDPYPHRGKPSYFINIRRERSQPWKYWRTGDL